MLLHFFRMVHAFTCTGLTETQYQSFGEAAGIGSVMEKTIDTSRFDFCFMQSILAKNCWLLYFAIIVLIFFSRLLFDIAAHVGYIHI